MSEFPPEPIEPRASLPQPSADQSEVLLRNRDVQALSRSFRRMAEVQEALLEHLDGIEESRSRRWVLPALALGSLVLGAGLATFGLLWYEQQQPQTPVEVQLTTPTAEPITVEAPAVTVQAPDNGIDAALLEALVTRMEQIGATQEQDRRLIAELSGRLVDGELGVMRMLKDMEQAEAAEAAEAAAGDRAAQAQPAVGEAPPPENGAVESATIPPDPPLDPVDPDEVWLGATNGLIALGGSPEFRFRKGTRIEGTSHLSNVLFLMFGEDGLIDSVVRADRVEFHLQQSASTLEMRFFDGTRTRGASKTLLTGGGLRVVLREVDVRAWLEHFPALREARNQPGVAAGDAPDPPAQPAGTEAAAPAADPASEPEATTETEVATTPQAWDADRVESVRRGIDGLISTPRPSGHYQLQRVESADDSGLHGVRLAWYDSTGRLFQYVEADHLEIAPRGEGWLELRFREGAFRRQDKLTPFQGGLYRLHLADQDLEAWRAAGAPILEPQP